MNVTSVFAKSNQAINNPRMEVAGCVFDLPTSVLLAQLASVAASCYAK